MRRLDPTIQSEQKTVEMPRVQYIDEVADIPVDVQRQARTTGCGHLRIHAETDPNHLGC